MPDIIIKNLTIPAGYPPDLVIPMLLRSCPGSKIADQIGLNWNTYFDFSRLIRITYLISELSIWHVPPVDLLKRLWLKGTKNEGTSVLRWVTMKHDSKSTYDLKMLEEHKEFINSLNEAVTESLVDCNHVRVWKKYSDYQGCLAEIMPVNQLPLLMTMIHNYNHSVVTVKIERRLKEGYDQAQE